MRSRAQKNDRSVGRSNFAAPNMDRNIGAGQRREHFYGYGADDLSEEFHGRPVQRRETVKEEIKQHTDLAVLGRLIEMTVLVDEELYDKPQAGKEYVIDFKRAGLLIELCSTVNRSQLILVGDDPAKERAVSLLINEEAQDGKDWVMLGRLVQVVYFTDKHHLVGPAKQKQGMEYEHDFDEDGGLWPWLIYSRMEGQLLIVGGSYTVEPEGIKG